MLYLIKYDNYHVYVGAATRARAMSVFKSWFPKAKVHGVALCKKK